jgi:hypothetical protein
MSSDARGAVIEIVERRKTPVQDTMGDDVIVPDMIRINGQELLCSADHPIKVHEVEIPHRDAVLVTLTVFARRVLIDIEAPEPVEI